MRRTLCGFNDSPDQPGKDLLTLVGPTLQVRIGFDPKFRPVVGGTPAVPTPSYPALVDTGASESCIDSTLANTLNLPVINQEDRSGAHGRYKLNIHLAQIYIPDLDWTIFGRFAGVHLHAGGQPHYALIGRTFLQDFKMIYEGETGSVIIEREK